MASEDLTPSIQYIAIFDCNIGVFTSQVLDVVKIYESNNINTDLIVMISLKGFYNNYKKIKEISPESKVIPYINKRLLSKKMFFKVNGFILKIRAKKNVDVICRGLYSTHFSLNIKKYLGKITFDARSSVAVENVEYDNGLKATWLAGLEKMAVLQSDHRISISNELVRYWENVYCYNSGNETVIPCSVSGDIENISIEDSFFDDSIIIAYSGGNGLWQSIGEVYTFLYKVLLNDDAIKVLCLTQDNDIILKLKSEFGDRVKIIWVEHNLVGSYLSKCDYGLLIRERKITNAVSSPVKFAEYLLSGLNVLITDTVCDYASFVNQHKCGVVIKNVNDPISLCKNISKDINRDLATKELSKKSNKIKNLYLSLLNV
ncbi:Glycosyltransferase-like [Moritella viscosa]|uniref:hypothetical protein n=1 Tax=Moritella viscosa TaxID=80854 RepID=UPI00091457CB|nr:hypothetical protein [Moritella viscosa]SGY94505.1 Glycosyltransferase-like [Moritella viscosa]